MLDKLDRWPRPPVTKVIEGHAPKTVIIVLVFIESGTGRTKLMIRFLKDGGGQSVRDATLIAQAQKRKESLDFFSRASAPVEMEIHDLETNGFKLTGGMCQ